MAPPPEYDKEPKAPDKSVTTTCSDDSKVLYNTVKDQQANPDHKVSATTGSTDAENKHVETLDDGQLRALLDEAITYKCPKDREGKSSLFKELLHEVEQDEQACEAARGLSAGRAARRGARGRRELQSNSLQDLVAAMAAEPAPRRPRHHPPAQVSARAHHGGSLPSDVNTSFLLSEEPPAARGGYLATVRCVNPPPLAERRVSASDANGPADVDLLARRSKPTFPMTYTARATLEIGSGSVCSGRAVTTTTASNQVDSAIPFTCITTPEVVASCNTTSSTSSAIAVDPKPLQLGSCYRAVASLTGEWPPAEPPAPRAAGEAPPPAPAALAPAAHLQPRSVISSNFNGLPLSRPNYGSTGSTATDEYKKSLDENGNAVQGFSSPLSGSSQHKKPRRKKSSKNETVIKSHQIDGYQGNKDLNEVLRFIESNADSARGGKLGRAKHKDDSDDKGGKKRAAGRKDKESKPKRASSLEELSRTKLEDLTHPPAPWPAPAPAKPERRSWGDAARDHEPTELTDFQTVTKRRKPRRRADDPAADPPRRARAPSPPEPRGPHEPHAPSDRSNDSTDDLDSVHSLPDAPPAALTSALPSAPLEPPEPRAPPPPPPAPPAPPAAPHASYADIARTRHNIPDLIESCNFYAEGEAAAAPPADGDYPALAARRVRDKPAAPPARARKEPESAAPPALPPAPDVVADRRPPVVLLDSTTQPRDMDGITFGFDVNEQLLGAAPRRARCDLVRDAPDAPAAPAALATPAALAAAAAVAVRAGAAALRYVPPPPAPMSPHLVDYVGAAWEDVVRCGGGKVRYFSE